MKISPDISNGTTVKKDSTPPFFSVVVIACNVGKYLAECLDSILAQTEKDFDVQIGIEESSDNTAEIADAYAARDKRISVWKTARSGSASKIRNHGIDTVDGEYVLFIDGDDWIEKDSLEKFRAKIEEFGSLDAIPAAIAVFSEKEDGSLTRIGEKVCDNYPDKVLSGPEFMAQECSIACLCVTPMSAYRTRFLREGNYKQPVGRIHEDNEWAPRVFCAAKRVAPLNYHYYNYRRRITGSATTTFNPKFLDDITYNIRSYFDLWRSGKVPEFLKRDFSCWFIDHSYRYFNAHSVAVYPRKFRRECFMRAIGEAPQYAAFLDMLRYAKSSKKLLRPIYATARLGKFGFYMAELFFLYCYSPLVFKIWPLISKRK